MIKIYFISVTVFSFLLYAYDKFKALKNSRDVRRISENKLLFSSLIGGTIGSIISMFLFRHKIKKISFLVKLILVIVIQTVIIYLYINQIYNV